MSSDSFASVSIDQFDFSCSPLQSPFNFVIDSSVRVQFTYNDLVFTGNIEKVTELTLTEITYQDFIQYAKINQGFHQIGTLHCENLTTILFDPEQNILLLPQIYNKFGFKYDIRCNPKNIVYVLEGNSY